MSATVTAPSAQDVMAVFARHAGMLAQSRRRVVGDLPAGEAHGALGELMERGKMARALVVHLAGTALGAPPEALRSSAEAVELLHAASLIHDDVIDGADRRRGLPALHVRLGTGRALVLGDWTMLEAFRRLVSDPRLRGARARAAVELLGRRAQQCCAGEDAELAAAGRSVGEAEYVEIARAKAGAQFAAAAGLGVLVGGGSEAQLAAAEAYGESLGIAYQIRDDVLDLCGDPAELGKPVANSLDRGRPLLALVYGRERGVPTGGCARADLIARLEAAGIMERVGAAQQRHVMAAIDALSALPQSVAVDGLSALARFAVDRTW